MKKTKLKRIDSFTFTENDLQEFLAGLAEIEKENQDKIVEARIIFNLQKFSTFSAKVIIKQVVEI